jgi:hypothetical protein
MSHFGVQFPARTGAEAGVDAADRQVRSVERTPNRSSTGILQAGRATCQIGPFPALQGSEALLYAARGERLFRLFLGSSAVEHSTVNRMVAGSNPARGAICYFI